MARSSLWIVFGLLSLAACTNTIYPFTTGSYQSLPPQAARLVIWGTQRHDVLVAVATWLERRGLVIVGRDKLQDLLDEHGRNQSPSAYSNGDLLRAGASLGVDLLVLVETSGLPSSTPPRPSEDRPPSPASVAVRAIDPKTGEVQWHAEAFYGPTVVHDPDMFTNLACQALATVWGFRPAGYHVISSEDMCDVNTPGRSLPGSKDIQQIGHAASPPMIARIISR